MASKQDIDRIIEATDIVALVSKYVKLEKNGKNYKGLCPFHHEDTPSFIVSPDKKLAHCFGCGGGGNPIKFLMQIENIDYQEAVARLAKDAGIDIQLGYQDNKNKSLAKYYKIMNTATAFYLKNILNTKEGLEAQEYLNKRGLDLDTINTFKIGLAPQMGDTIYKILKESNYLELDMTDVGLVDKNVAGYYDMFHDRIMFPIINENGDTVGFSARWYKGELKGQPKYINTRETILFKKGEILYNLNLAKGEIMKKKRFILHEGQMDVIASYRSDLKEAICTMGTALTMEQARLLKKYASHAIICYDADSAGIKASRKAIGIFKAMGMQIHLVLLPDKMDPDEYVKKYGSEAYRDFFESNMVDSTRYLFETTLMHKDLADSEVCEATKAQIFELLNSIRSATEIEDYLKKAAEAIGCSLDAIADDFQRYARNHTALTHEEPSYPSGGEFNYPDYPPYQGELIPPYDNGNGYQPEPILANPKKWNSICELRLFRYARASRQEAMYINRVLEDRMEAMTPDSQRLWMALIDNFYANYQVFDEGIFLKIIKEADLLTYYFDVIERLNGDKTPYNEDDRNECLIKLKEIKYDKMMRSLDEKYNSSLDQAEQLKLLSQKWNLKRKINELKKARRK